MAVQKGITLDTARMFTSLTLISLLASPLIHLFQTLPALSSAVSCLARIQEFLRTPSRNDYREMRPGRNTLRRVSSAESWKSGEGLYLDDLRPSKSSSGSDPTPMISFRDASLGWAGKTSPLLQELNFQVNSGELVILVGPVGSGKSTLLKGMLAEVLCTNGQVFVSTTEIAYCDQASWLINASVRDNVTGESEFDEKWYHTVLRACALEQDIQVLAEGDRTVIGSKGVKLSGGQKQRLVTSYRKPFLGGHSLMMHRHWLGLCMHGKKS
jgi:ATP-binding cassette subfamily C (CFTR/MRP) protein 1